MSTAPSSPRRRRTVGGGLALATAALLVACASGEPGTEPTASEPTTDAPTAAALDLVAGSTVVGLPDGFGPQPTDAQAGAARSADDTLIYVVTFGSSTCPAVPDDTAEQTGDGAVTVTFPEPGDGPCTMDYVPATTVVALPDDADPAADLDVTVGESGTVTLPAGDDDVVWALATS